jgi:hypothetical protein
LISAGTTLITDEANFNLPMLFEAIHFLSSLLGAWKQKYTLLFKCVKVYVKLVPYLKGGGGNRLKLLESSGRGKYLLRRECEEIGENYTVGYVLGNATWWRASRLTGDCKVKHIFST